MVKCPLSEEHNDNFPHQIHEAKNKWTENEETLVVLESGVREQHSTLKAHQPTMGC